MSNHIRDTGSFADLGDLFEFVFDAELDLDAYANMVEGDLALDDVVLSPGCV